MYLQTKALIQIIWHIYATTQLESQWYNFTEQYDTNDPYNEFEGKYGRNSPYGTQLGNTNEGDGYTYLGRGFIHLTGRGNYSSVSNNLGLDNLLLNEPYRAAQNDAPGRTSIDPKNYITNIAVLGMKNGWFTELKLEDYDIGDGYDFRGARAIINWPGAQGGDPRERAALVGIDFAKILSERCPLGGLPAGLICKPSP